MHRFTITLSALVIFPAACGGSDSDSNQSETESTLTYEDLSFLEKSFVDGVAEGGDTEAAGICILDALEDAGIDANKLAGLANEEPSPDVLAAIFSCSTELFEGGLFGGDDPDLDALWDDCDASDYAGCATLWIESPFGSNYDSFAETCGALSEESLFVSCELEFG
jgi:hypothetical protein